MHSNQIKKQSLIWLQGITCNGNAHSFLNHPNLKYILEDIEILYHPILPSKYSLEEIVQCRIKCDILIVEGTYSKTFKRDNVSFHKILMHYVKDALNVIAVGTCASFGGLFKESDTLNNSGLLFDGDVKNGVLVEYEKKVINLSGCPIHPQWLGFVLSMLVKKVFIELDELHRPIDLYSTLAHHGCTRNEYFEWKVDTKEFGEKEGCLFYKQGCRAPMTHSSCNKILWNEVSSKTRIGTPCFGCTQPDFPRKNLFYTKTNMSIPQDIPLDVPKRAYLTLAGVAKTFHIKRLEGKLIDYKKFD